MLKTNLVRWWVAHKDVIRDWKQWKRLLQVRFKIENESIMPKYNGLSFPTNHITNCIVTWRSIPQQEWTHAYYGYYLEELVHRTRSAQRNKRLGKVYQELQGNVPFLK
jgi:hypothetical protein